MMIKTRVDWFRVVVDLNNAGLSTREIAILIDKTQGTLLGWKNYSAEPRHSDGQRLLALWILHIPDKSVPVPMTSSL